VAFDKVVELTKTQDGRALLKKQMKLEIIFSANFDYDCSFCHDILANDADSLGVTIDSLISPFMFVCQYGGDNRVGVVVYIFGVTHLTCVGCVHMADSQKPVQYSRRHKWNTSRCPRSAVVLSTVADADHRKRSL
jgi:hypothetical protein